MAFLLPIGGRALAGRAAPRVLFFAARGVGLIHTLFAAAVSVAGGLLQSTSTPTATVNYGFPVHIRVHGLRELERSLGGARSDLGRELRAAMIQAGEPVRREAEAIARREFPRRGIPERGLPRRSAFRGGGDWTAMRVGYGRHVVYVAPRHRASRDPKRKRRQFAPLLLHRAMEPALMHNQREVEQAAERALESVLRRHGL